MRLELVPQTKGSVSSPELRYMPIIRNESGKIVKTVYNAFKHEEVARFYGEIALDRAKREPRDA